MVIGTSHLLFLIFGFLFGGVTIFFIAKPSGAPKEKRERPAGINREQRTRPERMKRESSKPKRNPKDKGNDLSMSDEELAKLPPSKRNKILRERQKNGAKPTKGPDLDAMANNIMQGAPADTYMRTEPSSPPDPSPVGIGPVPMAVQSNTSTAEQPAPNPTASSESNNEVKWVEQNGRKIPTRKINGVVCPGKQNADGSFTFFQKDNLGKWVPIL